MGPRAFLAIAGAIVLFLADIAASRAATVIFYSEPEQYFGWAAGYNYTRSRREALDGCDDGGSDCKLVIECDGGWAAIAFSDDFARGVAFSCGFAKAAGARGVALASCIAQSRTLCWTSLTVNNNGNDRSEAENLEFDRTWYAQVILYALDLYSAAADGQLGGKTRAALKAFQERLGLESTGVLDDALLDILVDSAGGRLGVARMARRMVDALPPQEGLEDAFVASATQPNGTASFSAEIATRPDQERRMALATLLSIWGTRCTLPARSAEPVPADGSGDWRVTCDEGEWTVQFDEKMHVIVPGRTTISDSGSASNDKPDPPDGAGAGQPAAHDQNK